MGQAQLLGERPVDVAVLGRAHAGLSALLEGRRLGSSFCGGAESGHAGNAQADDGHVHVQLFFNILSSDCRGFRSPRVLHPELAHS